MKPDLCSDTSLKSLVWDTPDFMVAGEDSDELQSVMPGVFSSLFTFQCDSSGLFFLLIPCSLSHISKAKKPRLHIVIYWSTAL